MSHEQEPLTPTRFEPAQPQVQTAAKSDAVTGTTPRWVLPALLVLVLATVVVLFWLPQPAPDPLAPATEPESAETGRPAPARSTGQPGAPEATPWSDAQQAQLRREAQDVLAQLLELQEKLEERGVTRWAPDDFAAAISEAEAADAFYKQREYVPAREHYEAGLSALQTIEESLPARVEEQLERARLAIEAGDQEATGQALELAALMDPDEPGLAPLQKRAHTLPEVTAALAAAQEHEAGADLAAAVGALQTATAADPEHQRARSELDRVDKLYTEERFNRAMSEGYAALDEARFDTARSAFQRARSLRPEAGETASALQELQVTETAHRLATLKTAGAGQESEEDWQAAVDSYTRALEIDPSVVFAQEGLQRAEPRAKLQARLTEIIEQPERLSDPVVATAAARVLAQAREVQPVGPVLTDHIGRIDRLLTVANQPITVTLRSDRQTSVTVHKVARLGQFSERVLDLRPGTYTAVGTRNGYRDVRRDFTVSPDEAPETVVIACTEPI